MDSLELTFIIDYAKKEKYDRLLNYGFAMFRTHLILNDRIKQLKSICNHQFKNEFQQLKVRRPHIYYRIEATIHENDSNSDSAHYYYLEAEKAFGYANFYNGSKDYEVAHFNLRFGEFLYRQAHYDLALSYLKKALKYYQSVEEIARSRLISQKLEHIYHINNRFDSAYFYASLERIYNQELLEAVKRDELTRLELEHEVDKKESQTQNEIDKRKAQFTYFVSGFIVTLFFVVLILGQYRNTKKQKQISDDLLLNILPSETATELKRKGKTTAKRFENATVLFSDIKGFTTIAEMLEPEELVSELDVYFRSYDEIIEKHGLEKIKTIGDAYLAVGGVPEENSATAINVINAAIDILRVTEKLKQERVAQNRTYFEVRIGCNTGPLVAGVVGSKKFQYDIWGDTVNVAARLEQHGEPGKINISSTTNDAISESFTTIYRGKVSAKNKGEIEMYFLEIDV